MHVQSMGGIKSMNGDGVVNFRESGGIYGVMCPVRIQAKPSRCRGVYGVGEGGVMHCVIIAGGPCPVDVER